MILSTCTCGRRVSSVFFSTKIVMRGKWFSGSDMSSIGGTELTPFLGGGSH